MLFPIIISIIIIQRLTELVISKKNEKWLLANGAVEYGGSHYKYIVLLHTFFFISMIFEYYFVKRGSEFNIINYFFLVFFLILQTARVSVLFSLGKYWNTKIYRIPNSPLVNKGLYKYFKHPNYAIVICELFAIPMIFDLYYTAIIFSVLNGVMLYYRISAENKVLEN
ncbi:MAG TPA: isoprenylcysteine carboxylmethyltransferase family protein [Ignavibacteria bacterium]|nr:isoprenylcysteine carboxylmethyltransferase family protein [Ignavibacteria bacterium]HRA99808.1 isoprenylcysteine carboxylmethyltransferase family protein [Ignavibacteria bacterium]